MLLLLTAWLALGFLSFGPAVFIFFTMRKASKKPWLTKVDKHYKPRISVIIPTYNEENIIHLKLVNLSRVKYPKSLLETVIVDSNSDDGTLKIVNQFIEENSDANVKVLVEKERKGKSYALNFALKHCGGEVIIVSDADCFWPPEILETAMPFLADSTVGAISGPKILLNSDHNWLTKVENVYLKSANVLRVGESKTRSTVFSEGGFIVFKKEAFDRFDPFDTGSDDCGTLTRVIERGFRAMLVSEAVFFSVFPISFRGRVAVKLRRTNQLVRVFGAYLTLLIKRKITSAKKVIIPNIMLYLVSPIAFLAFSLLTIVLFLTFPFLLLAFVLLAVPFVRLYLYVILESNLLLLVSIFAALFGKRFSVWSQPEDRKLLTEEMLRQIPSLLS